ncbi:hypothetical protein [Mycobacterium sp. JS623]|uniref:hypothetical protein n=1 Tax=Mycobacterium sp. JS623 TaxID=212767 RepID=UPI00059C4012|nr:hypothetical protein [Mycobacterium sp. JS623]
MGSTGTTLSGTFKGTVDNTLAVSQVHTLGVNDTAYKTTVTLTNVSGTTLTDVEYMRSFDPDNTRALGGSNTTVNTVLAESTTDKYSLVTATSLPGDPYETLTGKQLTVFYYTKDPRATVYVGGFTNSNPYDFDDLGQADCYTKTSDDAIGIVFKAGNLAPGLAARPGAPGRPAPRCVSYHQLFHCKQTTPGIMLGGYANLSILATLSTSPNVRSRSWRPRYRREFSDGRRTR